MKHSQIIGGESRTATTLSLAFSIGGILLLAGCSTAPSATGAVSADSGLEQIIKEKLASDPSIQAANIGVAANSARNEVILSGTVPSETLRLRAVELAKSAQPNLVLTDKIEVKPSEVSRDDYTEDQGRAARDKAKALGNQVGKSLDDAWAYSIIMARLAADPDTSAIKVHVDVTGKVVTLRGRVGSVTAKTEAERLAKDTQGVSAVHNLLTVAPEG